MVWYALLGLYGLVVGGTLRHLQGGLDAQFGMHRWQDVTLYSLLVAPAAVVYWHTAWFGVPWLGLLKVAVLLALFIVDMVWKQDFSKPWKVVVRFGTLPVAAALVTGWLPLVLVGPVLGACTWVLKKYGPRIPLLLPYWDGWEAGWELAVGGVTGAAWSLAPVLGPWPHWFGLLGR